MSRVSIPPRAITRWSRPMVDLVKIRKKAKEKKSGGAPVSSPAVDRGKNAGEDTGAPLNKLQRFLETAGKRRVAEKKDGLGCDSEPSPSKYAMTLTLARSRSSSDRPSRATASF